MRNKILFLIAFSLLFFTLACTDDSLGGGSSIDPNANPAVYADNSSSSNDKPGIKGGVLDFKSKITQTLEIAKNGKETNHSGKLKSTPKKMERRLFAKMMLLYIPLNLKLKIRTV